MWQALICIVDLVLLWRLYLALIAGILLCLVISLCFAWAGEYLFVPIALVSFAAGIYWQMKAGRAAKARKARKGAEE
jgi:hypothetical protein